MSAATTLVAAGDKQNDNILVDSQSMQLQTMDLEIDESCKATRTHML